jgi:hypothetical protein
VSTKRSSPRRNGGYKPGTVIPAISASASGPLLIGTAFSGQVGGQHDKGDGQVAEGRFSDSQPKFRPVENAGRDMLCAAKRPPVLRCLARGALRSPQGRIAIVRHPGDPE